MCILLIAIKQHPDYPLVVAANRDEYHQRGSRSMHWWQQHPTILAGRDLVAGGTWLGVNAGGQLAAVTNFRAPKKQRDEAVSRGLLPLRFLAVGAANKASQIQEYSQFLAQQHNNYNPFNLVYGDRDNLYVFGHGHAKARPLTPGCYALSNGNIDQPWPKMSRGVKLLRELLRELPRKLPRKLISESATIAFSQLLPIMTDQQRAAPQQLPDTGVSRRRESELSSIFIRGDNYGTRTTTLLLFSTGRIDIAEYNYDNSGAILHTGNFEVIYG